MKDTIKYTSENGYTGVLYGKSSLSIYNPDGRECFHTWSRGITTYDELVRIVDQHPQFMKMLADSLEERQKHIGEGYT